MNAVRGWLSAAALCALTALAAGGVVNSAVAAVAGVLALAGIWVGESADAVLRSTWVRFGLGAGITAGLVGLVWWLDGGQVLQFGSALLMAVLVAGTLERPSWRSLASLTWVVGLLLLLAGLGAPERPVVLGLVGVGLVGDLFAVVAAQRVRSGPVAYPLAQPTHGTWTAGAVPPNSGASNSGASNSDASNSGASNSGASNSGAWAPMHGGSAVGLARWYVAPVGLAVALAVLGLLVVLGTNPTPRTPAGGSGSGAAAGAGTASGAVSPVPPPGARQSQRSVAQYSGGWIDMRARGDLPDVEVYSVSDSAPGLWRASVLDSYDGTRWWDGQVLAEDVHLPEFSAQSGPALAGLAGMTEDPLFDPSRSDADPQDPAPGDGSYEVEVLTEGAMPVISPGVASAVSSPAVALSPTLVFALNPLGESFDPDVVGGARQFSVRAAARADVDRPQDAARLRSATPGTSATPEQDTSIATDARWTALPAELPRRVRALAQQVVGRPGSEPGSAPDRYAAVVAVERYLRTHATYTLDSPVPPEGRDAVDHFLFTARRGFCEQFAASEVVMLRAVGIPARMAVGYAAAGSPSSPQVLTGPQAHAWVEVYFPGVGWVSSDPTAGSTPTPGRQGPPWWVIALAALALLAVVVVIVIALRRRRRRRADAEVGRWRAEHPDRAGRSDLLAAFHGLERALARAGAPRRPAESIADLGARLDVPAALAVLERVLYADSQPPAADVAAAAATLEALTAVVLENGLPAPAMAGSIG